MRRNKKLRDNAVGDSNTSLMDILGNSLGGVLFILLLVMVIMVLLPKQLATLKPLSILPEGEEVIELPPATIGEPYNYMLPTVGGNEGVGFAAYEVARGIQPPSGLQLITNPALSILAGNIKLRYLRSSEGVLSEPERAVVKWNSAEVDFSTNSAAISELLQGFDYDISKWRWAVRQEPGRHRFRLSFIEPEEQVSAPSPQSITTNKLDRVHTFDADGITVPTYLGFVGTPEGPESTNEFMIAAFSTPIEQGWSQVDRIIKVSQPKKLRLRVLSPSAKRIRDVQNITIVTPTNLPDVRINANGEASVPLVADGGVPPFRWEIQTQRPNEMSIGGDGRITFRTKEPAEIRFKATVHSANGDLLRQFNKSTSASQDFVWRVLPAEDDLQILVPEVLSPAVAGDNYSLPLAARGGTGVYRWSLGPSAKGGAVPEWLTTKGEFLNAATSVATPRQSYFFTLKLTDGRPGRQPVSKEVELPVVKKMLRIDEGNPRYKLEITTAEPLPDATKGVSYPLVVAARGGIPPYHWTVTNCLHRPLGGTEWKSLAIQNGTNVTDLGLGFNFEQQYPQYNGLFAGTPKLFGEFKITFRVVDSDLTGNATTASDSAVAERTLKVLPSPEDIAAKPLKIVSPPKLPDAIEGVPYELAFSGTGGAPPYEWSVEGKVPKTFGFKNPSDGVLAGSPDGESVGIHEFLVVLSDRRGAAQGERLKISLKVRPGIKPLTLLTTNLPLAAISQPYDAVVLAEGGERPLTWQRMDGSLPAGLNFDSARGAITGIPSTTTREPMVFKIRATSATGQSAEAALTISVAAIIKPTELAVLTPERLPVALLGRPYLVALSAQGGIPPYRWERGETWPSMTAGIVKLSEGGVLENRIFPTIGEHTLTATMTDSASNRVSRQFRLAVIDPGTTNQMPIKIVMPDALPAAVVGAEYKFPPAAEGGWGYYSWSAKGSLPQGLSLVDNMITGTPTSTNGTPALVTLTVTDAAGGMAAKEVTLRVVAGESEKGIKEKLKYFGFLLILLFYFILEKANDKLLYKRRSRIKGVYIKGDFSNPIVEFRTPEAKAQWDAVHAQHKTLLVLNVILCIALAAGFAKYVGLF